VGNLPRLGSAKVLQGLKRFLEKLEMLIGFLSLVLATFLLRLEARRLGRAENVDQALALLSAMTMGALVLVLARKIDETLSSGPRPS